MNRKASAIWMEDSKKVVEPYLRQAASFLMFRIPSARGLKISPEPIQKS